MVYTECAVAGKTVCCVIRHLISTLSRYVDLFQIVYPFAVCHLPVRETTLFDGLVICLYCDTGHANTPAIAY